MSEKPKLPEVDLNELQMAAKFFIVAMLNTNATTMKMVNENFRDPSGNILGTFEISVKKLS